MPRCARCQFVAFDQDNIGPTFLRQVIQRRTASNPAPDNNNFGARFHMSSPDKNFYSSVLLYVLWSTKLILIRNFQNVLLYI